MELKVKQVTSWERAYEAALSTVGKRPVKGVTDEWKDKMLMAEHSPIRLVEYDIYLYGIPSFVATHLVRHHIGCEKFVITNREDRRNVNPEEVNRLTPVDMMITCNAQALINISRKRLCTCASKETREVWKAVKDAIAEIDPIMAKHMVRECEYRNMCPEIKGCGYYEFKMRKCEHPISEEDAANFNQQQINIIQGDVKLFHKIFEEGIKKKEQEYIWDFPKSMFHIDRVAFNKCKTSRKRKGLYRMIANYQEVYMKYHGEIKTTNKKHHGFVTAHTFDGGLVVICDDAKMRFVKENDVVYL